MGLGGTGVLAVRVVAMAMLPAQTVVGTAVDAGDGEPIGGAYVLLVDGAGEERARTLTSASGAFRLPAGRGGTYRLRLERIGFEDAVSVAFSVPDRGTVSRRLAAAPRPIELAAIRIEAEESQCGTPSGEARQLGRVWEEARKALVAATWTDRRSRYRFETLRIRRQRDDDGTLLSERTERHRVRGRHPFRAIRPEDLELFGWVFEDPSGVKYYGPDADVMLSASFLDGHCFRLVRSDSAHDRLIGIAFRPVPDRERADISGVLWLDRATAELRTVDYRYVNLPLPVESDRVGGTIEFDRLPDGGWIVRSWEIRSPVIEPVPPRRGDWIRQRYRISALEVEEWRVLAAWRAGVGGSTAEPVRRYPVPENHAWFAPVPFERVELSVGGSPHFVLPGDFTDDGLADLLVSDVDGARLVLFGGDGAGGFRRVSETPAGEQPAGLATADLDGDGIRDVVVANHETDYLTLLRGTGSGDFTALPGSPLRLDVSPHPHAVAAVDLTRDGHVDILVDDRDGEGIRLYTGDADGGFVDGGTIDMGGDPYRGMLVRDLDGDGISDLATPNERSVGVRLGLGSGEFAGLAELDAGPVAPFALVAADVDGDGVLDLAAADGEGSSAVIVFPGEGGGGFGAAGPARHAGTGAKGLAAADFDRDGTDDLVVSSWNSPDLVFLPGGHGRLAQHAVRSGTNPWGVAVADFDGDGRPDVAVANAGDGTVSVLLNRLDVE